MAKERLYPCESYVCEGSCASRNKECRFWHEMQICPFYKKKRHSKMIRENHKDEILNKIIEKELRAEE